MVKNVEPQALESMMDHQIDSIIHSSWAHRQVTPPEILRKTRAVLVNCSARHAEFPSVVSDEIGGGLGNQIAIKIMSRAVVTHIAATALDSAMLRKRSVSSIHDGS